MEFDNWGSAGKFVVKYYSVILIVFLSLGCSVKDYDYKVELSNDEYKILKKYVNKYKSIRNEIAMNKDHNKNYVLSNDRELLELFGNWRFPNNSIVYASGLKWVYRKLYRILKNPSK